jgi:hypothetical protein
MLSGEKFMFFFLNLIFFFRPLFPLIHNSPCFKATIENKAQKTAKSRVSLYFKTNVHMSYELTGKLVAKFDTVQRTENFKTREFVIEKSDEINGKTIVNYVKFQSVQDKTALIDRVNTGDMVKVYFNIRGSRWERDGRVNYITNLDAWRIEQILQPSTQQGPIDSEFTEPLDTFTSTASDGEDLPF